MRLSLLFAALLSGCATPGAGDGTTGNSVQIICIFCGDTQLGELLPKVKPQPEPEPVG